MDSTVEYKPTQEDLRIMREWLTQIPYLPVQTDEILSIFIKAAKGSIEKAKIVFDNYHHGRLKFPEFLKNLDPCTEEQQAFMDHMIAVPLPKRTKDGNLVVVCRIDNPDAAYFNPLCMYRQIVLILRYYMFENDLRDGRVEFIYLSDGLTFDHAKKFTPKMLMGILSVVSNSAPIRIRGIHYTAAPGYVDWVWNMCKRLLKPKIAQRIHCHKDESSLHSSFQKEILPQDIGGEEESLRVIQEKFREKLATYRDRFLEEEEMLLKFDPLRPHADEHIAVGTFRKLDVD